MRLANTENPEKSPSEGKSGHDRRQIVYYAGRNGIGCYKSGETAIRRVKGNRNRLVRDEQETSVKLTLSQRNVLDWYRIAGRDLPWRETRDPWLVLLSEMMLQQTQAVRIWLRWPEFSTEYPTPAACAEAPLSEVIALWSGLGFNKRAISLHRCATQIMQRFDGEVPQAMNDLQSLAGVGPYTARAVRVFAFELDDAVLDTNVARILARVTGRSLKLAEAQATADSMLPHGHSWVWNQGLLDIGATICRPKQPNCAVCPLKHACAWRGDFQTVDPAKGSAAVSKAQSKFVGSDRQGRGRLVLALKDGPIEDVNLAAAMGWPTEPERAVKVAATLAKDGLVVHENDCYRLPG